MIRPFIAARRFQVATGRQIDLVVLHTPQFPEKFGAARALANYFARGDRAASTHAVSDDVEIVECVRDEDVAYGAAGANLHGIHLEIVGYAEQGVAEWGDDYSRKAVALAGGWVAEKCDRYKIPHDVLLAADLRAGRRGITTHAEVEKAWPSTGHTDPGRWFPMDRLLAAAFPPPVVPATPQEVPMGVYAEAKLFPNARPDKDGRWPFAGVTPDGHFHILNGPLDFHQGERGDEFNDAPMCGFEWLVDVNGNVSGYVLLAEGGGTFSFGTGLPPRTGGVA